MSNWLLKLFLQLTCPSTLWVSSHFPSSLHKWIFISPLSFASVKHRKWCQCMNLHFPDAFIYNLISFTYKSLLNELQWRWCNAGTNYILLFPVSPSKLPRGFILSCPGWNQGETAQIFLGHFSLLNILISVVLETV